MGWVAELWDLTVLWGDGERWEGERWGVRTRGPERSDAPQAGNAKVGGQSCSRSAHSTQFRDTER
jgi:hypothetical protein